MNKKRAIASLAIVSMALLATITMVSPTQAFASTSLEDVFQECLDELGDSPEEEKEEVRHCFVLGYDVQEDSDTPTEGTDEDDEDDTNVD
jgi:hypothetical protein